MLICVSPLSLTALTEQHDCKMSVFWIFLVCSGIMAFLDTTQISDEDVLKSVLDLESQQFFYKFDDGLSDSQLLKSVEQIECDTEFVTSADSDLELSNCMANLDQDCQQNSLPQWSDTEDALISYMDKYEAQQRSP